jgi:uncharacterized protein YndB with AHSA1/START domain
MKTLTFDAFTKKIYIKAPVEKLYWCWATEEGIISWFLRSASYHAQGRKRNPSEFIQPGDDYVWTWHNWDGQEQGKVIEANGKDTLVISFAGACRVTLKLENKGNAALLTLTQSEIPTDENNKLKIHYGCSNGWTFWLANLKAHLEYGILLNEVEFDLTKEELAGYEYVNM